MDAVYPAPGYPLQGDAMTACKSCKQQLASSASHCPQCGTARRKSRYKNKTVAAVLAFFFGAFGAHRFYLGQWRGLLYLLFFWLWVPGIIALIECFYFAARNKHGWDAQYNEGVPAGPGDKTARVVDIVVLVTAVLLVTALIGVLAGIALPAYKDYEMRVKAAAALSAAQPLRAEVEQYLEANGHMPQVAYFSATRDAYDFPDYKVSPASEGIVIQFKGDTPGFGAESIVVAPVVNGRSITWYCTGGTLPNRYRPAPCRVNTAQPASTGGGV